MFILTIVRLTTYVESAKDLLLISINNIAIKVLFEAMKLLIKIFKIKDIVKAHRSMKYKKAITKIVMLTF